MKRITKATPSPQHEKFTEALASVLSVAPAEMKEKLAQAKAEKPSPHTR